MARVSRELVKRIDYLSASPDIASQIVRRAYYDHGILAAPAAVAIVGELRALAIYQEYAVLFEKKGAETAQEEFAQLVRKEAV